MVVGKDMVLVVGLTIEVEPGWGWGGSVGEDVRRILLRMILMNLLVSQRTQGLTLMLMMISLWRLVGRMFPLL
jgi:hypothetical protein